MKKILVTGGTGFCGSYLCKMYLDRGYEVYGIKRWRSPQENIKYLDIINKVKWVEGDIVDSHSVDKVIKKIKPDVIHHLAAQSSVKNSWVYPVKTIQVNMIGTLNIFEAVREYCPDCIIHVASTSEVYGIPKKEEIPIKETMLPRPCSPYGVSKLAMDTLSSQYVESYGLKIVITRAFNHTGAGENELIVCSAFARQVARVEKGLQDAILHGNLDSYRDFTDVEDICRAYMVAVDKCDYGIPYNICSGNKIKIEEMLNTLIKLSTVPYIYRKTDPKRMRPSDLCLLQGDATKFKVKTGWRPQKSFLGETLPQILDYWRKRV